MVRIEVMGETHKVLKSTETSIFVGRDVAGDEVRVNIYVAMEYYDENKEFKGEEGTLKITNRNIATIEYVDTETIDHVIAQNNFFFG